MTVKGDLYADSDQFCTDQIKSAEKCADVINQTIEFRSNRMEAEEKEKENTEAPRH